MCNRYLIYILMVIFLIYLLMTKSKKYEYFIQENFDSVLINDKESAIKHLQNIIPDNMTDIQATQLYDKIFVDLTDQNLTISAILNSLDYLKENFMPLENNPKLGKTTLALCNIINSYGLVNNLPWIDNNELKPLILLGLTKERVQQIYKFDKNQIFDFKPDFSTVSNYQYYDFIDIIRYNKYNSSLLHIINRHPILNSFQLEITNFIQEKIKNNNLNKQVNDVLNMSKSEAIELLKVDLNYFKNKFSLPPNYDREKLNIIYSIYFTLFQSYDNNLTINDLTNNENFINSKNNILDSLAKSLNKLTLFITCNYNYIDPVNKNNLNNASILQLNNIINNIKFYSDLSYLRTNFYEEDDNGNPIINNGNKTDIMPWDQIKELLNIFYENYSVLNQNTITVLYQIIYDMRKQDNFNDEFITNNLAKVEYIKHNCPGLLFDAFLLSLPSKDDSNKKFKCTNVPTVIKYIRTLIKRGSSEASSNLIINKITRYSKIKDISNALIFGIY